MIVQIEINMLTIERIEDICFISDAEIIEYFIRGIENRRNMGTIRAMQIYVYNREGDDIPHFHIRKIDSRDCCLKILDNDWFIHGKNDNTLSHKELKLLYEWLNQNSQQHWKNIIEEWNKHSSTNIDINISVPKYDQMGNKQNG